MDFQPNSMDHRVNICQMCGVTGYEELLVYCDACQVSAEHRYCLPKVPPPDEEVIWSCHDCLYALSLDKVDLQPTKKNELTKIKVNENFNGKDASKKTNASTDYGLPVFDPVWRGCFDISNELYGMISAHISSKACLKVWKGANVMPPMLRLELLSRSDVWPKRFDISPPTDDNIALYLFHEDRRDFMSTGDLVHQMIDLDLALRAVFENSELLIFSSDRLPLHYWSKLISLNGQNILQKSRPDDRVNMISEEPVKLDVEEPTTSISELLGNVLAELEGHVGACDHQIRWEVIVEYFREVGKLLNKQLNDLEEKEKALVEKESETHALVAEREASVASKEQAMVDRIQEVKDKAVASILEARKSCKPASPELVDSTSNNAENTNFSNSFSVDPCSPIAAGMERNSPSTCAEHPEAVSDGQTRSVLTQFCKEMDVKGLLNFINENRKDISAIFKEIPVALASATAPAQLVLDSLGEFYPHNLTTYRQGKKTAAFLHHTRRTCVRLLESLGLLLVKSGPGPDASLIPEIKQRAKAIADGWKAKLAEVDLDNCNVYRLEVQAFLLLLTTFKIASDFDEEQLLELVVGVIKFRQIPGVCRSLGLPHKMAGIVEKLIDGGRHIHAVRLVHTFKLTDKFPLVPLLKMYLNNSRRTIQGSRNAGGAVGFQEEANVKEPAVLRAVIRCVKDYKLEEEYPLDRLENQVAQLEMEKANKKRKRKRKVVKCKSSKRSRVNRGNDYKPPSHVYSNRSPVCDERQDLHGSCRNISSPYRRHV